MDREIHLYVDGRSFNNYGSGFAVVMISKNNKWLRSLVYGKYSVNQIDLLAVKFALLSINNHAKSYKITVYTKNDYIVGVFNRINGIYVQNPSFNIDFINDVKKIIEGKNITFEKVINSDISQICKDMAIDAVKNKKIVDIKR
jgi:ribonuclease HI